MSICQVSEYFIYSQDINKGCTIISGEQDLIAAELNFEQKIWLKSTPTLSAEIAEQKGAPVNSNDPPITATRPFQPLEAVGLCFGKIETIFFKRFELIFSVILNLILILYNALIINNNHMSDLFDYRTAYYQLKNQNQILKAQIDDALQRQASLKRQIEIMSQIQQEQNKIAHPLQQMQEEELTQIKQRLISILGQKQQIEALNRTYLQKINDLKYNNGELKNLNQKLTHLHARQLEMVKRESFFPQKLREMQEKERILVREKEIITKQLQQVAKVAQQMQIYYVSQIRKKNDQLKHKQEEINRLNRDLEGSRTQRMQQGSEKWQRHILALRQQHQVEVDELRSKITFLINKIQNEEQKSSKPSLGGVTTISAELIQSKMLQSNSSIDSFRMNPSSSASDTRRTTSGAKTPNKYIGGRMGKSAIPLMERNI